MIFSGILNSPGLPTQFLEHPRACTLVRRTGGTTTSKDNGNFGGPELPGPANLALEMLSGPIASSNNKWDATPRAKTVVQGKCIGFPVTNPLYKHFVLSQTSLFMLFYTRPFSTFTQLLIIMYMKTMILDM